jgi:hypothetical protein
MGIVIVFTIGLPALLSFGPLICSSRLSSLIFVIALHILFRSDGRKKAAIANKYAVFSRSCLKSVDVDDRIVCRCDKVGVMSILVLTSGDVVCLSL